MADWSEELDAVLGAAVRKVVPDSGFDDALQEARLAVLEAPAGHTQSWYITKGVWAAQKWLRNEQAQPISIEDMGLAETGGV